MLLMTVPLWAAAQRVVTVGWYEFGNLSTYDASQDPSGGTSELDYPDLYGGYNYEYLRMISQINDWDLRFVRGTMMESLQRLQNGEVDIVGGVARTPAREELFAFPNNSVLFSSIGLIARGDDDRYAMNDMDGFTGMRIGAVQNSNPAFLLREWCRQRNISVEITYFASFEQMHAALDDHTVDAVTDSLLNSRPNRKILCSIDTSGVYFAVNKNEPELVRQLDDAITYIAYLKPGYQEELTTKYFSSQASSGFSLSEKERAYLAERIASGKPVVVSYNPDWFPIEYKDPDSGEIRGIMPEIFKRISTMTGLTFQFVAANAYDDTSKLYHNDAEILASISTDFSWADQHISYLTQSFFNVPIFMVSRAGLEDNNIVALPMGYHLTKVVRQRLEKSHEDVKYHYYDSVEACLKAVQDGSAGRTYINSYEINYYMSQGKYAQLTIQAVPDFTESTSIGVSKQADPLLFSIICKALRSIDSAEMDNIILNATKLKGNRTLLDFVYAHLLGSMLVMTVFALLIFGVIFFYYSNRRNEKLRRELEAANRTKSDFLSRMSHDIRKPMNAIMGLTEIASQHTQEAKTKESLYKIGQSSQFLMNLINDILDISSMENDKFVLRPVSYTREDFAEFIDSTIVPLAQTKGLEFSFTLMDDVPGLCIDKIRFNQIFTNLLGNAIKFTPPGGHVWLSMENKGIENGKQLITAVIADDGLGIGPEFLKHIFEAFSQEKTKHTKVAEGTGLGLAIVKRIVDMMGGTIEVQSEKGQGTTFILHLQCDLMEAVAQQSTPSPSKDEQQAEAYDPAAAQKILAGKRVLIVEDNEINQEVAKAQLEAVGVDCEVAGNGQEALALFSGNDAFYYDAILMDIRMPIMDGKEATRRLRKLERQDAAHIPIIALTADAFEDAKQSVLACGMDAYLAKPIYSEALYKVLVRLLTGKA
jgi:signal transduction histidine kinase/ActR/RegA family two-component response regulator